MDKVNDKKETTTTTTTTKSNLFSPIQLGPYTLPNRICMAALTRCRADPKTGVPNDLHVEYYTQRAIKSAFILTECTYTSPDTNALSGGPGIHTEEQVAGWKKVTDSVHKVGGRIILQIWHCGRAGRSSSTGVQPVAPSPLPLRFLTGRVDKYGKEELSIGETPKELDEEGMKNIIKNFKKGAENALKAGFDGLELHGANGYLIDEFLRDATNIRKDKYGGSVENRCRFPLQVIDVLVEVFGSDRVGMKVTPVGRYQDMFDSDPIKTYEYLFHELSKRNIAFVELLQAPEFVPVSNLYKIEGETQIPNVFETFRKSFTGVLIGNNTINKEKGNSLIESGLVDMVSFGRFFISNPDLVERFENNWELNNNLDYKSFATPGAEGYIDYPRYEKK